MIHYFIPYRRRGLLWQMVKREVQQKFLGSWLGLSWALITPLAMLSVYTFVFRSVLNAKWPGASDSNVEFALQIFSGLLVYGLFSEVIGRAANLIIEQPNLVKKVIFPLEILPWVTVLSALFFSSVSFLVLLAGLLVMRDGLTIHVLSVPLIAAVFAPMLLGLSWLLASLGVYLRDINHIVSLLLAPMLFLSPIFYPTSALPEFAQSIMQFNPLTVIIEAFRGATLGAQWPDFMVLGKYFVVSIIVAILGATCFKKIRTGFADVL
jgi:lipopolysaccharide transport system permease protein